jgi:pimeloyl-ACP methyl ester carboxylesterase
MVVGWSLGVQVSLTCFAKHPNKVNKLFLLNPATGLTLHTALQPFHPFPLYVGKQISYLLTTAFNFLKSIIHTSLWVYLKDFFESFAFLICLEVSSFLGGFPPEQAAYFQEYMRDVFSSRYHTRGLLDLILALDAPVSEVALGLSHKAIILSGLPDFMTGVYHSYALASRMSGVQHTVFTMASHFLLLEWPDLVAMELLKLLFAE